MEIVEDGCSLGAVVGFGVEHLVGVDEEGEEVEPEADVQEVEEDFDGRVLVPRDSYALFTPKKSGPRDDGDEDVGSPDDQAVEDEVDQQREVLVALLIHVPVLDDPRSRQKDQRVEEVRPFRRLQLAFRLDFLHAQDKFDFFFKLLSEKKV